MELVDTKKIATKYPVVNFEALILFYNTLENSQQHVRK